MSERSCKRKTSGKDDSSSSSSSESSDTSSVSTERLFKSPMSNLILPVPRIKAMLKVHNYASRVSDKSAVYLTAVLEYVTTEILELSLNAARSSGVHRIQAKHINKALKTDHELLKNFGNTTVVQGGVVPFQYQKFHRLLDNTPLDEIIERNSKRLSKKKTMKPKTSKRRRA